MIVRSDSAFMAAKTKSRTERLHVIKKFTWGDAVYRPGQVFPREKLRNYTDELGLWKSELVAFDSEIGK